MVRSRFPKERTALENLSIPLPRGGGLQRSAERRAFGQQGRFAAV